MQRTIQKPRQKIAASVIGNALEWYDFILYGFLSAIIARQFFPMENDYLSLLASLATFGVGFFMRPLGGVVIGMYADRQGRKRALQLIIVLMTLSTAIIVFTPNYESIGILAPVLILVARLMQGFATGGEYASSTAFLVEDAPPAHKTLFGSWQLFGQCLAVAAASAIASLVTMSFSPEDLNSWAWRLPFALGLLICPVGFWIRYSLNETDEFSNAQSQPEAIPLPQVVADYKKQILTTIGLITIGTVAFYVVLVNMPNYASRQLGLPIANVFNIQLLAVVMMTICVPLFGMLGDRIGRKRVLLVCNTLFLLMIYPLYAWVAESPSLERLLVMQLLLCLAIAGGFGATPTTLVSLFPTRVRTTAMSIGYNLAVMIFGGFASFIVTWLTATTGSTVAPAFYLIGASIIGVTATLALPNDKPCRIAISAAEPSN